MSALYRVITSRLTTSYLVQILTKAEYAALERFCTSNSISDLSESIVSKIHAYILQTDGQAAATEFGKHLTRFYVAVNLQIHEATLKGKFHNRSWQAWAREERSMSEDTLTFIYTQIGVEMSDRPVAKAAAPALENRGKGKLTSEETRIQKRLDALIKELGSDSNKDEIEAFTHKVEVDQTCGNYVRLYSEAGSIHVVISVLSGLSNAYRVTHNALHTNLPNAPKAVKCALDYIKAAQRKLHEDKMAKKSTEKSAPAFSAYGKLVRELRNTDWEDSENFGKWEETTHNGLPAVQLFAAIGPTSYTIVAADSKTYPYTVVGVSGKTYASPADVLRSVTIMLDEEFDEDEEDDDEFPPEVKSPKPKAGRKVVRDDDDDDAVLKSLFSAHQLARCPNLGVIDRLRAELLEEAGDDLGNVSSVFSALEIFGKHSLTLVVAEYWPKSFEFGIVSDDEEEPEFTLECADFLISVTTEQIVVTEYHGKGASLDYCRTILSGSALDTVLDYALAYFYTWSSERVETVLTNAGFSYGSSFRGDQNVVEAMDKPATPTSFFNTADDDTVLQMMVGGNAYSLIEFLRDECGSVRGVAFQESADSKTYTLSLFAKIDMTLHAVRGRDEGDITVLVADAESANMFFASIEQDEEFTLADLCNRGMTVNVDDERTSLSFKAQDCQYVVHIFH